MLNVQQSKISENIYTYYMCNHNIYNIILHFRPYFKCLLKSLWPPFHLFIFNALGVYVRAVVILRSICISVKYFATFFLSVVSPSVSLSRLVQSESQWIIVTASDIIWWSVSLVQQAISFYAMREWFLNTDFDETFLLL